MQKRLSYFTFCHLIGLLLSVQCFATKGGLNGGGADAFVRPDRVVLADPYAIKTSSIPKSYHELFSKEIKELANTLISAIHYTYGAEQAKVLSNAIAGSDIEYFVVDKLPGVSECLRPVQYEAKPAGDVQERVACTVGEQTWIVDQLFRKMPVGDQVLTLAHEGFRRLNPVSGDLGIFRVITGLGVMISHAKTQESGVFVELSTEEQILLLDGVRAGFKMEEWARWRRYTPVGAFLSHYRVWPLGGGLVDKGAKNVAADAKIGIGAWVDNSAEIDSKSELALTAVCMSKCKIAKGAKVNRTDATDLSVAENAVVEHSVLPDKSQVGEEAIVKDSRIEGRSYDAEKVKIGTRAQLIRTYLGVSKKNVVVGADAKLTDTSIWIGQGTLDIADGVSLTNLKFNLNYRSNPVLVFGSFILAIPSGGATMPGMFADSTYSSSVVFPAGTKLELGKDRKLCSNQKEDKNSVLVTQNPLKRDFVFTKESDLTEFCND